MTKGPYLFDEFFSSNFDESLSPFLTPSSRKFAKNLSLKGSLAAAVFLFFAFILSFYHTPSSYICLLFVYFLAGTEAFIETIKDIKKLNINIDVLMTLAAFLSVLIDSALEGGLLLVLFALSGAMEDLVERKSRSALYKLHEIAPTFALVVSKNGSIYEKSIKEIQAGTHIMIRPGDVIALDGKILKGSSFVNLVHLTGESQPISKQEGDMIQAGALNLDGSLVIEVTKSSSDSTLSRIIKLINEAQQTKPKVQNFLDQFSRAYAVTIICLSASFMVILPLFFGIPMQGNEGAIYRSLAFLIAASPCAIIIATPTAYLSAISACARKGVLLKGGGALDALAECKMIAFDKTGTLTTGNLRCRSFERIYGSSCSEEEALSIAGTLERQAAHPIAKAIYEYVSKKELLLHEVVSFRSLAGFGLEAVVLLSGKHQEVFIGNPKYILAKANLDKTAHDLLEAQIHKINFPLCVLLIGNNLFLFSFVDELRANLKENLLNLKEKEKLSLVILTGDHKESALQVANQAGIDQVHFDLRPEDKLKKIEELSTSFHLAMVGDGINDAPALARSTVGISMGEVGSDTAIDASDIVLLKDDLSLIQWTFSKSKATLSVVRQNLTLALGVIFLATTPALLGWIPLWLAVILHEGGTVIVGINSLRLLKK